MPITFTRIVRTGFCEHGVDARDPGGVDDVRAAGSTSSGEPPGSSTSPSTKRKFGCASSSVPARARRGGGCRPRSPRCVDEPSATCEKVAADGRRARPPVIRERAARRVSDARGESGSRAGRPRPPSAQRLTHRGAVSSGLACSCVGVRARDRKRRAIAPGARPRPPRRRGRPQRRRPGLAAGRRRRGRRLRRRRRGRGGRAPTRGRRRADRLRRPRRADRRHGGRAPRAARRSAATSRTA